MVLVGLNAKPYARKQVCMPERETHSRDAGRLRYGSGQGDEERLGSEPVLASSHEIDIEPHEYANLLQNVYKKK